MAHVSEIDRRKQMLTRQGFQWSQLASTRDGFILKFWTVPYETWLTLPILHDDIITSEGPYLQPGNGRTWDDELLIGVPIQLPKTAMQFVAYSTFQIATRKETLEDILVQEVRLVIQRLETYERTAYFRIRCADLAGYWAYTVNQGMTNECQDQAEKAMTTMMRLRAEFLHPK